MKFKLVEKQTVLESQSSQNLASILFGDNSYNIIMSFAAGSPNTNFKLNDKFCQTIFDTEFIEKLILGSTNISYKHKNNSKLNIKAPKGYVTHHIFQSRIGKYDKLIVFVNPHTHNFIHNSIDKIKADQLDFINIIILTAFYNVGYYEICSGYRQQSQKQLSTAQNDAISKIVSEDQMRQIQSALAQLPSKKIKIHKREFEARNRHLQSEILRLILSDDTIYTNFLYYILESCYGGLKLAVPQSDPKIVNNRCVIQASSGDDLDVIIYVNDIDIDNDNVKKSLVNGGGYFKYIDGQYVMMKTDKDNNICGEVQC